MKIDEYWKVVGETRRGLLDSMTRTGVKLTEKDVLKSTIDAVCIVLAVMNEIETFGIEDQLHDIRTKIIDSPYFIGGRKENRG